MHDFTDRSQFRIGELPVIPGRLIGVRDGQEITFEPRWREVLLTRAEHSGETLSSERLLIEVWGSTVSGNSPVGKMMSCLRKSIGDDSRKLRYIETVSKVGDRLIPLVSVPEEDRCMPSERWTEGSPYVGPSAFDADHASALCGRSRIVADPLKAMRVQIGVILEVMGAGDVGSRTKGSVANDRRRLCRRQSGRNKTNLSPAPTGGQDARRSGSHGCHNGCTSTPECCGNGIRPRGFH